MHTDNKIFDVKSLAVQTGDRLIFLITYFIAGIFFGIVLIKAEVVSWYRIQEMFRFQSFHMFGVIGSAVVTGALSTWLIKKLQFKTVARKPVEIKQRTFHKGVIYGGLLFGFGWALTGACPGPLYALTGAGAWIMMISLLSAIAGTWVYGLIRNKLPH
jgi:uncharacterized membrane protein YedE/YeeE